MATSEQTNDLVALYAGYFNRAPDPAGLQFWIDQIDAGRDFNTIAEDFAASSEATALYPYLSTPAVSTPNAFVTSIYMNLFNRAPDADGLAFWTGVLADGSVSAADMIEAIIIGARDDADAGTFDKATLDNKVEVGLYFANEAANTPGFTYDAAAAAAAVAVLDGVTDDDATVDAGKAETDAFIETGAIPGTPGDTFTLTTDIDTLVGTSGDDTFRGTDATLNQFDSIDGGAGVDTLDLYGSVGFNFTGLPVAASLSNVEIVNLFQGIPNLSTVDASAFGGDVEQLWQIKNANNVSDLGAGQTAGFRDATLTVTEVAAEDTAASASVALDNVEGDVADNVVSLKMSGEALATVNVSGTIVQADDTVGADAASLALEVNLGEDVADVVVNSAFTTDLTLNVDGDSPVTFASTGTGAVTVDLDAAGFAALEAATFGAGADDVTIGLGEANTVVNLGVGADIIEINGAATAAENYALSVTLGAGSDTVNLTALSNIADATEAAFADGLISIADFAAGTGGDVLDISGLGGLTFEMLINTEISAIANADSLFDAVELAAGYNGSDGVMFNYGGNGYILSDNDGAFNTGDGLIELVGMSVNDFSGANFIA